MMSGTRRARCFRDLMVYQKAREVARRIFELTKVFPKEEIYSLTDQGRRASRSVGAQIAEAWGKRRYERHFVSKLTDADSEQLETQHWLETAFDCGYISEDQRDSLCRDLQEIGRMLNSMIEKAASFCASSQNSVREKTFPYFTDHD
jgi:four helix bundle protein